MKILTGLNLLWIGLSGRHFLTLNSRFHKINKFLNELNNHKVLRETTYRVVSYELGKQRYFKNFSKYVKYS